jgi:hypothetical protein
VGDVVSAKKDEHLTVSLRALSRFPIGRLQLISNGEVLKEISTEEQEATIELRLPADRSRWVVARCSRSDQWNAIWQPDIAHTSAIYVHVDHEPVFREDAAREWINRMRLHIRDIRLKGVFGNDAQRQEAIEYTDESIRRYERLIDRRTKARKQTKKLSISVSEQADDLLMLAPFASNKSHDLASMRSLLLATDIDQLRKAVDPLVLCAVTIDAKSQIQVHPRIDLGHLSPDRTHRFLIEIHNQGKVQVPLSIQPVDRSPSVTTPSFEVRIVENIFSSAKLIGEEFEWKLIELRWREAGDYQIEVSASDLPIRNENRGLFRLSLPAQ